LGGLVRAAYGCYDTAKAFGTPFISGKDSLYNEYAVHGKSQAIPGTLLISALAVMDDIDGVVSMYSKAPGDLVYIVGTTHDELGASHYYDTIGAIGNKVPVVRPKQALEVFRALSAASSAGLVCAMHDCSDGGMSVALAEMAFAGGLGMDVFLSEAPYAPGRRASNDVMLFSESNSRFIVEVGKKDQGAFEKLLGGVPHGLIGCVSEGTSFRVYGVDGSLCIQEDIANLKEAWQKPLRW
jgi:phosphoribosylformylglycinamidine synthase